MTHSAKDKRQQKERRGGVFIIKGKLGNLSVCQLLYIICTLYLCVCIYVYIYIYIYIYIYTYIYIYIYST